MRQQMDMEAASPRNTNDTSDEQDNTSWFACCKAIIFLLIALSLVGSLLAVFVLSIYFLVIDYNKGGICASTTGYHIWLYFLIKSIIGCFSQLFTSKFTATASGEQSTKKGLNNQVISGVVLVLLTNLG
jgi:hypothetical protein